MKLKKMVAGFLAVATFAGVSGIAAADQIRGDTDADALASPHGNGGTFNQTVGTTVAYDLSALVEETGNANDDVFKNSGDTVTVTITRGGDWLDAANGGTPSSFVFSSYNTSQSGTIRVTVPSTAAGVTKQMTAVLSGDASNDESINGLTLRWNVAGVAASAGGGVTNTAPTIAWTANASAVAESSATEHTYSFAITDPNAADTWTFDSGYPTCGTGGSLVTNSALIDADAKAGTFKCTFDDGPATPTVSAKVSDGTASSNELTQLVDVTNAAPAASLTRSGPANIFTGTPVTYNASATDPSAADTAAGFFWAFNNGSYSVTKTATSSLTQTYTTCGAKTESVVAKDKDGGESSAATAGTNVFDGGFFGAIKPAVRNQVQKGRVIPVQIAVSCAGAPTTGLTPAIQLINGDHDPNTDPDDTAVLVPASVSSADSTGVMRPSDGGYIYNLSIPSNTTTGQKLTILVKPWGSSGEVLKALIEIRK